jgi:hypothetical protein
MADFYLKTVGQAWAAMVSAFTGNNQLTYNASGFSITWNTAGTPYGGYFTVAGTVSVGSTYANGNYHAAEARSSGYIPIASILAESGMGSMPVITTLTTSGILSLAGLADALQSARATMITDQCGGTSVALTQNSIDVVGSGTPAARVELQSWKTSDDCAVDVITVTDLRGAPAGAPISYPFWPTMTAVLIPPTQITVDVGPQLDTDQAINNGSSIQTVVSKQFTGI